MGFLMGFELILSCFCVDFELFLGCGGDDELCRVGGWKIVFFFFTELL